jgi:phosphorylcholine metabolism protein LicD
MSTYVIDDTKTMLMMNQERWHEMCKHVHDFKEDLPIETRVTMLFEVDAILKHLNIPYYLTNGTALGFVRDKAFIPWDDDIDIDIYSEIMMPKFKEITMLLVQLGYVCRVVERGETSKISAFKNNFKVSLGCVYLEGDFRKSSGCSYPKKYYENSVKFSINDKTFDIPGPVDEYLSYLYKDWKTPIKSDDVREYNRDYLYR